jgi:GntR family transcriptional regulator
MSHLSQAARSPAAKYAIDHNDTTHLHKQVATEIRRSIAEGDVAPGERLPPARDIAAVLGVNANTVYRALRALREEGLLEFRQGRGITVAREVEARSVLVEKSRELLAIAGRYGYRREDIIGLIEGLR